mmetsp:Transcript_4249/g.11078  ORF Transcript_4249/g.11078 Transcript_4249/m.11078 type:complete len:440 (+) Transcript_4249:2784-4103(+)
MTSVRGDGSKPASMASNIDRCAWHGFLHSGCTWDDFVACHPTSVHICHAIFILRRPAHEIGSVRHDVAVQLGCDVFVGVVPPQQDGGHVIDTGDHNHEQCSSRNSGGNVLQDDDLADLIQQVVSLYCATDRTSYTPRQDESSTKQITTSCSKWMKPVLRGMLADSRDNCPIQALHVTDCSDIDADSSRMMGQINCTYLELKRCSFADSDGHIFLRSLQQRSRINDASIDEGRNQPLSKLCLHNTNIDAAHLKPTMRTLTSLKSLHLYGCEDDDNTHACNWLQWVDAIRASPSLTSVFINGRCQAKTWSMCLLALLKLRNIQRIGFFLDSTPPNATDAASGAIAEALQNNRRLLSFHCFAYPNPWIWRCFDHTMRRNKDAQLAHRYMNTARGCVRTGKEKAFMLTCLMSDCCIGSCPDRLFAFIKDHNQLIADEVRGSAT